MRFKASTKVSGLKKIASDLDLGRLERTQNLLRTLKTW